MHQSKSVSEMKPSMSCFLILFSIQPSEQTGALIVELYRENHVDQKRARALGDRT